MGMRMKMKMLVQMEIECANAPRHAMRYPEQMKEEKRKEEKKISPNCHEKAFMIIASARRLSIAVVRTPHDPPRRLRCPKDRVGSCFVWEVASSSLTVQLEWGQ